MPASESSFYSKYLSQALGRNSLGNSNPGLWEKKQFSCMFKPALGRLVNALLRMCALFRSSVTASRLIIRIEPATIRQFATPSTIPAEQPSAILSAHSPT